MGKFRKTVYALGGLGIAVGAAASATILGVERYCVFDGPTPQVKSEFAIADAGYARAQGDSFLTFPEWYIVHAYNDLARVTEQSSESAFDYLASIKGFWTSLCGATRQASLSGPSTADQKATNYIIGFSFTAEMALQGIYDRSIGALSVWTTGGKKTAEDEFNLRLLKEYAAFLYQTPWYQYPFAEKLNQFWHDTPFVPSIRSAERRFALTLQYAGRAAYAALMRLIAGYDPADLTIRSVIGGVEASDIETIPGVKVIREVTDTNRVRGFLVETQRYAAFDRFVRELGDHAGASLLEVAGNHRILVTVVSAQPSPSLAKQSGIAIFSLPIQSWPGRRRIGIDMPIRSLVQEVRSLEAGGEQFEHAYDY